MHGARRRGNCVAGHPPVDAGRSLPPGLDGAQRLALGRGMDGQAIGRSTEGAYAPLVPVYATAESVAGPLSAVRLLAAASSLVLSLAVWFVARGALGSVWGLIVTSIVIPASALAEPTLRGLSAAIRARSRHHRSLGGLPLSQSTVRHFRSADLADI